LSRRSSLIVVSGPSGAGKSTVMERVLAELDRLRFSVSHTTRPPRPGEQEGVQYYFVDEERFAKLRQDNAFLEWATVHAHRYGTSRSEYERAVKDGVDLLLDLDVQGAAQVRLRFPDAVTVFILPPSFEALERRLRGRGAGDERSTEQRLRAAAEELPLYKEYDYTVINDDLDRTVDNLKAVVRAARCRTTLVEPDADGILGTFPGR
jgi:guanylate kinase